MTTVQDSASLKCRGAHFFMADGIIYVDSIGFSIKKIDRGIIYLIYTVLFLIIYLLRVQTGGFATRPNQWTKGISQRGDRVMRSSSQRAQVSLFILRFFHLHRIS